MSIDDDRNTTIPIDGRERLIYILADGSWTEPADSAGYAENLDGRDRAVLRALLAEALRHCGVATIPSEFPIADSARVDRLISTLTTHLGRTSEQLGQVIARRDTSGSQR